MNEELRKLINIKIKAINIFINQSGFEEAAKSKHYQELYGIRQACRALGIPMDYFVAENGLIELS